MTRETPSHHAIPLLALALSLLSTPAQATHCVASHATDRPHIGLALGGGGARGYAHVGVLKFLEERRIPVDYVAGTSMGSIVGGFLASGMRADEIRDLIEVTDWNERFTGEPPRQLEPIRRKGDDELGLFGPVFGVGRESSFLPGGVVAGQNILLLFEQAIGQRVQVNDFNRLPIPFRAVATDIVTGQVVILAQGSVSAAMRASMAVPGAFDPVRRDGKVLVDGGLVRNLPVDVVREMGAEIVIAVDVGTRLMPAERIGDVLSVVEQMTSLMIIQNTERQIESLHSGDILIRPELGFEVLSSDFDRFDEVMPLGYDAAVVAGERLQSLALSEADYAAWRRGIQACEGGLPEIQFVRLDNRSRFSDAVLRDMIHVREGQPLDTRQLEADLQRIHALGFIRLATYEVVEEDGKSGVQIRSGGEVDCRHVLFFDLVGLDEPGQQLPRSFIDSFSGILAGNGGPSKSPAG